MKRKTAKEILADSFRELADQKAVNKITVKDITENCGYSTATFYRQFKDKYDLIAWDYSRALEEILSQINMDPNSWKQALIDAATYFCNHKNYLANLFLHTSGYDSFIHNMTEIHYNCFRLCIMKFSEKDELDVKTDMYVRVYSVGTVIVSCDWILGKYNATAQEVAEIYENSLPEAIRQYLHKK